MRRRYAASVAAALVVLTGCSGSASHPTSLTEPTVSPTLSPTPVVTATPKVVATPRRTPAATKKPVATVKATQHAVHTSAPKPSPLLVTRLNGVGSARQVISVTTSGYGTSSATLQAFEKTGSTWHRVFGPWSAHIGRHGFAPPGDKREGHLRTPSRSYGFQYMFGVKSNLDVRNDLRWRGCSFLRMELCSLFRLFDFCLQ